MADNEFLPIDLLCEQYQLDVGFLELTQDYDLIEIRIVEGQRCIARDHLKDFEKLIQFHFELNINLEGIEVIFQLLEKVHETQNELSLVRSKLNHLENHFKLL